MDDHLYGHKKILREVTNAFLEQGGGKIGVIIGVDWNHTVEDVKKELRNLKIKEIKHTDLYVWAELTENQVKKLADKKSVFKIWYDRKIQPMAEVTARTIKSKPALELFGGTGKGITWAVLDTGIKETHTVFSKGEPVVKDDRFNFTTEPFEDKVGHGTHVAGIIKQLAPEIELYDFKVLGKGGSTSFTLIQAMYQIRKLNFDSPMPVIHGANLSLGGPTPVGSYGCGFSPECQEANRLMNSGVVVCVAASNDGYKILATIEEGNKLEYFPTFMNLGISDPGNAEDVITVGSTHKSKPHTYGISWFSSKGPTGDGRFKPDVVAPGEQIRSAGIDTNGTFVPMSGTSMATPVVSAAIAQFLSIKPEFIGQTHQIKKMLMNSCTDLNRDKCFQGAGLIDVMRLIQSV